MILFRKFREIYSINKFMYIGGTEYVVGTGNPVFSENSVVAWCSSRMAPVWLMRVK